MSKSNRSADYHDGYADALAHISQRLKGVVGLESSRHWETLLFELGSFAGGLGHQSIDSRTRADAIRAELEKATP